MKVVQNLRVGNSLRELQRHLHPVVNRFSLKESSCQRVGSRTELVPPLLSSLPICRCNQVAWVADPPVDFRSLMQKGVLALADAA